MTYEEIVKKIQKTYAKADASSITEHVAIQFNVRGEGEGAFYLEIADGKIDIQPYEYYDRDAIITIDADTLMDVISGKLEMEEAFNAGRLYVDGDAGKALLLKQIAVKKPAAVKAPSEKKATAKKAPAKKAPAEKKAPAAKKAPAKKAPAAKKTSAKETTEK